MGKQCSFCGSEESANLPIIEGAEANICRDCAETSVEELSTSSFQTVKKGLKPHEIKQELDKKVVGQDEAKKILSVAVYNHYKRIESKSKVDIQKSNVLLIGPTGSGKTYLIEALAQILDVPLVIGDASALTQAGYVGEDVDSLLEKLIIKARGDIQKAERGIVYIDEIDKIAGAESSNGKRTKDIAGQAVQEGLLKILENSEVHLQIPTPSGYRQRVVINTKNILFICGGAFVGLDEIVKKRATGIGTKQLGFTASPVIRGEEEQEISQKDLVSYGFIPEFVGRLPLIATLNPLGKDDLMNILVKPKDAIVKQYQALFKMDGIKLKFQTSALEYVAEEALKKNIGARGLKGILEKKMNDIMFWLPQENPVEQFVITKEMLTNKSFQMPAKEQISAS